MQQTSDMRIHLHDASNKVRRDLNFSRHKALAKLGEAAICHDSECRMNFLKDTHTNTIKQNITYLYIKNDMGYFEMMF